MGNPVAQQQWLDQMNAYGNSGLEGSGVNFDTWRYLQANPYQQTAQQATGPATTPSAYQAPNLSQYLPQPGAFGQPAQPMNYTGNLGFVGFQPGSYWNAYPDARWENTGLTPQQHYLGWGMSEGRTGQSGMPGQVAGFPTIQNNYGLGFGAPQSTPQQPLSSGVAGFGGQMNFGSGMGQMAAQGQAQGQQQGPIPQPQLPALQGVQPTNPFGAMGLQAYRGQVGMVNPPQQQASGPTVQQAALPAGLRAMQQRIAASTNPVEQRMMQQHFNQLLQKRAGDAAAEAAKPWFLQQGKPGQLDQIPPEQRRQYMNQRNQARTQYFQQNPNQITSTMKKNPYWAAMAGDYSPFMDKASVLANEQQALYDKYQLALNQQGSGKTLDPKALRYWSAIPGAAKNKAANLSPQQALAAASALGVPLSSLQSASGIDILANGPMDKQAAARYLGQQAIKRGSYRFGRS